MPYIHYHWYLLCCIFISTMSHTVLFSCSVEPLGAHHGPGYASVTVCHCILRGPHIFLDSRHLCSAWGYKLSLILNLIKYLYLAFKIFLPCIEQTLSWQMGPKKRHCSYYIDQTCKRLMGVIWGPPFAKGRFIMRHNVDIKLLPAAEFRIRIGWSRSDTFNPDHSKASIFNKCVKSFNI